MGSNLSHTEGVPDTGNAYNADAEPGVNVQGGLQENSEADSFGTIVPTVFSWAFGGHTVYVTGAWDDWRVKIPLARSGNEFSTVLSLPLGYYQYKFIVDGNWRYVLLHTPMFSLSVLSDVKRRRYAAEGVLCFFSLLTMHLLLTARSVFERVDV